MIVNEFIKDKIDIALLTETWLKDTPGDQAWINQSNLTQSNIILQQHNQQGQEQRRRNITTIPQEHWGYTSRIRLHIHNLMCTMEDYTPKQATMHHGNISPTTKQWHNKCNVYRWNNRASTGRIAKYNNVVILRDLNMHIDDLTNADSYIFNGTMHAFLKTPLG